MAQHRMKTDLQREIESLLMASPLKRHCERIEVTASLRFPTSRRRDENNHSWLLDKACGDALQNGGWLPDDTPDRYRFVRLTFEEERGPARTRLFIEDLTNRQEAA